MLAGEEEGVGLRLGHGVGGIDGAGGDVAVGAAGEGVGGPVVRVGGDEGGADEVLVEGEDFRERGAGVGSELRGGFSFQR